MIFWTRDGRNLVRDSKLLEPYKKVIHFTLTGWQEVEHKAPQIDQGLAILGEMVQAFGADNITWRFSPVPTHPEALERFKVIAEGVQALGIKQVYVSFLQNNDRLRDDRSTETQRGLLEDIARLAPEMAVLLCNENKVSVQGSSRSNLRRGVCEDGRRFSSEPPTEGCGCALAVDPFTVNESCHFGCEYCYAADKTLAPKKFNTTKALPVVR
jgi:DNA repair photolyase